MAKVVLTYPKIASTDGQRIDAFRRAHDEIYYGVVDLHFTLVFPDGDTPAEDFVAEVREKIVGVEKFDFELKCATVNKDAFSDYYHTFLVPDQGYSSIVKLHDHLYSGTFKKHLRLDIDYIPHIGLANSKDKFAVKKWADQWNASDFTIKGTVDSIVIADFENNTLHEIEEIKLL